MLKNCKIGTAGYHSSIVSVKKIVFNFYFKVLAIFDLIFANKSLKKGYVLDSIYFWHFSAIYEAIY